MADDTESKRKEELKRWKDYAGAILIAMPIILAVTALAKPSTGFSLYFIISIVAGLISIGSTVMWYAGESTWKIGRDKPGLLLIASWGFGLQLGILIAGFLVGYLK
jgi:hypothetical protein